MVSTNQFSIRSLLVLTATVAVTFAALTGSLFGLMLSLAFVLFWTPRPLNASSLQRAFLGAVAGYCVAYAFFAGSFPFGPAPSTQNLCIIVGAAGALNIPKHHPRG